MSKRFTKIICAVTASTFILGAVAAVGCSDYYNSKPLDGDYSGEVSSNGGFAVEKGNYIYYINGAEEGTAVNDYGTPVKGAIYRISKSNLEDRNYSKVQRVVPNIVYSGNYNAGIFIYGDRIYYGTPSTAKNSEGVVQNSYLDMKSSKLDGTQTLKEAYVSFPSASYEYRYVEDGGTVYLLYVATSEKLYEESTGVTNLHSYNTKTGKDTLLAYNVGEVTFDSENKTNPRVYYTMNVRNYASSTNYGYNQLYTVKASATKDKFADLDKSTILGWNTDKDEGDVDRYVNCGDLVLDGIGRTDYIGNDQSKTPFNYAPENDVVNDSNYTYTVRQYVNDTVYYTRSSGDSANHLFALADKAEDEEYAPITNNPKYGDAILSDGSAAGKYMFVTVDGKDAVLCAESKGGITINYFTKDGNNNDKLGAEVSDVPATEGKNTYFPIVKDKAGTANILSVQGDYVYYSLSGGTGYTIHRVDYTGDLEDYNDAKLSAGTKEDYEAVKILDLDASSSWYLPEFIDNHILFATTTANMTNYKYIMVFDLADMDNGAIRDLNKQYESVTKTITDEFGNTDNYPTKTYANLTKALQYAFYNGSYQYLQDYAKELNGTLKADEDRVYSDETFAEYDKFLKAEGVWAEYKNDTKTVNGKEIYANNHDYYYAILGEMSGKDKDAYAETLRVNYLAPRPTKDEGEKGWYEGLSTVEQVFFIIGMCLIGIIVIGGGAWLTVYLVRRKKKQPEERRRRIKVDTTDDKSVDVYDYQE